MAVAKKRKKFFKIEIPVIRKETQLQAYEEKELEGRVIKYDLTRFLKGKSSVINLKVEIKEGLVAVPKKIQLMPYFIRRVLRKGTNYVEDSFSTKCKDSSVRIKPFLITRRKVSRAVRKALRNRAKEFLIEYVKDKSSEILFEDIIKNHIQKNLSLNLKKIYPLSFCDIRVFQVEEEKD